MKLKQLLRSDKHITAFYATGNAGSVLQIYLGDADTTIEIDSVVGTVYVNLSLASSNTHIVMSGAAYCANEETKLDIDELCDLINAAVDESRAEWCDKPVVSPYPRILWDEYTNSGTFPTPDGLLVAEFSEMLRQHPNWILAHVGDILDLGVVDYRSQELLSKLPQRLILARKRGKVIDIWDTTEWFEEFRIMGEDNDSGDG